MKKLHVDAAVLDLRQLSEETLDAYESCTLDTVVALTNRRAQNLLARKGVRLDAALTINSEEELEVNVINGKVTLDGNGIPEKKQVLVVNGKLFLKPEAAAVLDNYESVVVNGKIYCPASLSSRVLARCLVNGKACVYPDDAVVLNGTVKLDRSFLLRAQPRLYWTERVFVAADPKLDAAALAATGAHFAGPKAILTESNAAVLAPLFSEDTQLIILPDGTTVLEDDLELDKTAFRRCGTRLYVMGDVTIAEGMEEQLEKLEYLHADGDVILPAALEETFCAIPELEYQELKLLEGHAIVGAPMLRLNRELLELYPEGVTCVGCATVKLDEDLEPDTIAKKLHFDGCAMIRCTARQENAVHAVSRDVARVQAGDLAEKKENDTVKINGVRVCL